MEQILPIALIFVMYGIYMALLALMLISSWYIFVKMGQPGWKGIVPYYNLWTMVKTLKKPISWFWIPMGAMIVFIPVYAFLLAGIMLAAQNGAEPPITLLIITGVLCLAIMVVSLVYSIKLTHALSKSFGHGIGFTLGLIFLTFIFYPILAFGNSTFTQPEDPKPVSPSAVEPETEEEKHAEDSTAGEE